MKKLLIIGGGNMGFAIATGITKKGVYRKEGIVFIEKKKERISFLKKNRFIVSKNISETIKKHNKNLELIIIAVKPNEVNGVLVELKNYIHRDTVVLSIAAGLKIKKLSFLLPPKQPIARVMPNTPIQIGEGMSAISYNINVNKKQKVLVKKIFQAVGRIIEIQEKYFDLITAISGSGPAYFCYLMEGLIYSAKKLGINDKTASTLVLQTAFGTADLLLKTNLSPGSLREMVTSPRGTTEAALKIFKQGNFYNLIYKAIKAAQRRACELSLIILFAWCLLVPNLSYAQEPIQVSTETEDIALTDDINIARAQVSKYPENPEAHFNLAIALTRTSLVEESIKELRKTKLLIRKPENKDMIEKKINEYKEILKRDQKANNIRYRLAFCYYLKAYLIAKEVEKIEKNKEKESSKGSKDPSKINLFGSKLLSLNEKNSAIKENLDLSLFHFKDLLRNNPTDNWAKIYYAFILAEQYNDINKAREIWSEVSKENPNNPAPHFFLGELHIKEGNLKEGILEISQAVLLRSLGY